MRSLILTSVIFLLIGGLEPARAINQSDPGSIVTQILSDYESVVSGPPNAEYVMAKDNYESMRKSGKIQVRILEESVDSLLKTMDFAVDWKTGHTYLDINLAALPMYEKYKTVFYSMLTHELWHAYAYVQDPVGYKDFTTDPFEKMMYQSDAYAIEAKFIGSILIAKGFKVTPFEQYLYDCYKGDSMFSFTSIFSAEDIFIGRALYGVREKRLQGGLDQGGVYEQCTAIGKGAIASFEKLNESSKSFDVYTGWISLFTFDYYVKLLVNQTEKQRANWDQIKADYPEFWKTMINIQEKVKGK
jgi:hypothetical protein